MRRHVVFDFGAVLFQWQPHELVAARLPQRAPDEASARALAASLFHHADWQAFDAGLLTMDVVVEHGAARLGLPRADLQALLDAIPAHLSPIASSVQLVAELVARRAREPGLQLLFLSNMPAPFARELERRHAFLGDFDGGLFSGDVHLAKPDPAIFALLEQRHGLEPASTLFIDDHPDNVRAAQARGWDAIHCVSPALLPGELLRRLG